MALQSYHRVWLSAHPERSEAWLVEHLADGFHVHHLDGDHANDVPLNLVLIESADHMMIHNCKARLRFVPNKKGPRGPQRKTLVRMEAMPARAVESAVDRISRESLEWARRNAIHAHP